MEGFQFISECDGPQAALTLILLLIWGQCSPAPLKHHRKKKKRGETWKNLRFCAFPSFGMSFIPGEAGERTGHNVPTFTSVSGKDGISCLGRCPLLLLGPLLVGLLGLSPVIPGALEAQPSVCEPDGPRGEAESGVPLHWDAFRRGVPAENHELPGKSTSCAPMNLSREVPHGWIPKGWLQVGGTGQRKWGSVATPKCIQGG